MKKIILLLIILFITQSVFSQKIILHRNVGGDQTYQLSSVDSVTFLPFACDDEIRYEGKTYHTVLIGSQCWMKENLNVGTMIPGSSEQTNNSLIEKYCYDEDTANCTIYGGLYQWNETMLYVTTLGTKGICPDGWHIPTEAEFQIMTTAVGNNGNALKEIGQGSGGGTGTNTSGFSALLTGARYIDGGGYFFGYGALGNETYFWNSNNSGTLGYYLFLSSNNSNVLLYSTFKRYGFSVRCLKN
jgi:uncharacterized protein (TIGR02145 family)